MKNKIFIFLLLIIPLYSLPLPELKDYIVSDNYLRVSLPVTPQWYVVTSDWYGERNYFFSPQQVAMSQLYKGFELDASLAIKILTMDQEQVSMDIKELMQGDMEYRKRLYLEKDIKIVTSNIWKEKIAGVDGVMAILTQSNEKEYLFLGKADHLMYEIDYQIKDAQRDKYLPIIEQIIKTIRVYSPEDKSKKSEFNNPGNSLIALPSDWYVKEARSGDVSQVFISKEKVEQEADIFKTGASITKISNFSRNFPAIGVTSDADIARRWTLSNLDEYPKLGIKVFRVEKIMVSGQQGYLIECSLRSMVAGGNYYIQEYRLITAKNGALYDVSLESPVKEFELYRKTFLDAVKSFKPL